MKIYLKNTEIRRTLKDKVITFANSVRFLLTESIYLKISRALNEHLFVSTEDETPLISITIPTYDRGKLLVDRTLPSIFAQTYQNFEIIIVGDCCVDETSEILSLITDPRVKFINLPKRTKYPEDPKLRWFISGVAPSNYALKIAKGKWISYFDDDDIMLPNYLEDLLQFAREGNFEFVAGLYEEERDGILNIVGHRSKEYPEFGGHSTWMYRSYLRFFRYNINSWRKSYNKPQDIDLMLRMLKAGVRMGGLNKVVSCIRPRPGETKIGLAARLNEHN
jgi:glycosyltransferase involved in cell wall biosynthesis